MMRNLLATLLFLATLPLASAQVTWTGASTSPADDFWSNTANWNPAGDPAGQSVIFDNTNKATSSATPNSIVDQSQTIDSLSFVNTGSSATDWQVVQINNGITLTLNTGELETPPTNILLVGGYTTSSTTTLAKITGEGSLVVNESSSNITISNTHSSSYGAATLDMSGLSNFSATVGTIFVGNGPRPSSTLTLAVNNSITADKLVAGNVNGSEYNSSYTNTINLGQTNELYVDGIYIAAPYLSSLTNGSKGIMKFQSYTSGPTPSVIIRGKNSTEANPTRTEMIIGSQGATANRTAAEGTVDFTGGTVDALLSNVVIADGRSYVSSGTGSMKGTLSMSSGIIDSLSLVIGRTNTNSTSTAGSTIGTLNVSGGTFLTGSMSVANNAGGAQVVYGNLNISKKGYVEVVQSVDGVATTGNIILGSKSGTAATISGTINLSAGGSLKVGGNIAEGSSPSGVTSTINLRGGLLDLDNGTISIDNFNVFSGSLKNLAGFKDGTGTSNQTLTKTGYGVVTLAGTNGYSGGTSITGGVLVADAASSLPSTGTVLLTNGAALAFNYSGIQSSLSKVDTSSDGSIALSWHNAAENIDFAAASLSNTFLGAYGHVTYTGNYTLGSSGVYRLGGGSGTLDFTSDISSTNSVIIGGGPGTVILSGNNDYTGGTTLLAGTLELTALNDIGTADNTLTFNGGTLRWGTGVSSDISSGRIVTISSGGASLDTHGNDVTLASSIGNSGSGGLTKLGSGTLTLQGLNTFTGPVTVSTGNLALDLGTHSTGVINSSSALNLSGGTLQVKGAASGTSSQTLGSVTLTGANRIALDSNGGSGTSLTLANTWTRNTGATLAISLESLSTTLYSDLSSTLQYGILPYVTVNGSALASVSEGKIVAYTGYTTLSSGNIPASDAATTGITNYNLTYSGSNNSLGFVYNGNNAYINSLTIGNAKNYSIDLTQNRTLHLGVLGTIYMTSVSGNLTIGNTGTNRYLTAGGSSSNTAGELFLINESSGLLTITAGITNNGSGVISVTKSGTGTASLGTGTTLSSYTGITTLNEGVYSVARLSNGGSSSDLGAATSDASNLVFNGGTLRYTGSGSSTDRLFTLGLNGGTIEASGIGAAKFTSIDSLGYSGSGSRSLTLSGTSTSDNTLSAWIGDNGGSTSLTKSGSGKWILDGYNDYSGDTVVTAGTLIVNGSLGGGSAVSVRSSATLGGNGTMAGSVAVASGGTLSPGDGSTATLGTGHLSIASGGNVAMTLAGNTAGASYDQLAVTGTVDITSGAALALSLTYEPAVNQVFTLISNDGTDAITGIFNFVSVNGVAMTLNSDNSFTFSYNSSIYTGRLFYSGDGSSTTGGNDLVLQVVPEPAPIALLLSVLGIWLVIRRRRISGC